MAKKRIIILGAGLAGLSAAWHLERRGIEPVIFEREKEVGGLCHSKSISGFVFDYSGHLLHFKTRYVFDLIKRLLGHNLVEHRRSAWVYFRGRYIRYPFQANLYGLPPRIIRECVVGFMRSAAPASRSYANFLDWIKGNLGEGIAKHFMIPYNTKFWTVHPRKLTCDWLDAFIPVPDFAQLIRGAVGAKDEALGYNERFWYPREGGIRQLPLAFASGIRNIHTACPVAEINLQKRQLKLESGAKEKFDWLVSTVALPELPFMVKDMPGRMQGMFAKLKWNSVVNLNLGLDKKDNSGRHWAYFPQKNICFFRLGFPHNFSDRVAPAGKSSLYAEVAYSPDAPVKKELLSKRIKNDLVKAGIINSPKEACCDDINDIKYAYPIHDRNYRPVREGILDFLKRNKVISCGRYGSWRYFSMEDAILDARDAVALLSKKA
ncbi:MAG: FAD-dependent oxidoreductase [Candidatus Omnitrophota bacterium]